MIRRIARGFVLAVLLCIAGCSSVYMKGTPLYTGEHKRPEGPPEHRVNLWPLAYYRKPALSVLWPFAEWTDDHAALRPVLSVYKLDKERHQWNFAAPLVQLDYDTGRYRVFPCFWGKNYFVAFPLLWWFEKTKGIFPVFWSASGLVVFPLFWHEKGEYCHLFPLWLHAREGKGQHDTHALWPFFRLVNTPDKKGFRAWPLVGSYAGKDSRYAYALWPFCHTWRRGDEVTRVAFPFYFEHGTPQKGWWLVPPLAYHRKGPDDSLTLTPIWSARKKGKTEWAALLPVFYRQKDGEDSLILTPLWSAGKKGEKRWSAVLPLYYHSADASAGTSRLITPLAARLRSPEKTRWIVVPLASTVAWGKGEKDLWLLGPVAHARWGGESVQHHVLPLYYCDHKERLFLSPLVSCQNKKDKGFFNVAAVLAHYARDDDDRNLWLLGPMAHARWGDKNVQHHVLPLYAYDRNERLFLSPLVSWQDKKDKGFVNLAVVLAHYGRKGDERDLSLLGPLVHARWGGKTLEHHVLPLYGYRRKPEERWFNLLLLLADYERKPDGRKDLSVLVLTSASWGGPRGEAKVSSFPFFAWESTRKTHTVTTDGRKMDVTTTRRSFSVPWFPPLLGSEWSERAERPADDPDAQTRLRRTRSSWLFPLWSCRHQSREGDRIQPGEAAREADFRLLAWLYDYRLRAGLRDTDDPKKAHDYVRSRILWRVMHYEWLDGDESLDVFPFITWDRKASGYRKFSFLWRLFRNERTAEGGRNLDVLFLPILRKKGTSPAPQSEAVAAQ